MHGTLQIKEFQEKQEIIVLTMTVQKVHAVNTEDPPIVLN